MKRRDTYKLRNLSPCFSFCSGTFGSVTKCGGGIVVEAGGVDRGVGGKAMVAGLVSVTVSGKLSRK